MALENTNAGISDYWLRSIKDIYVRRKDELGACIDEQHLLSEMCEINVVEQVGNLVNSKIVQTAWQKGQKLSIHGWIYSIEDGIVKDLEVTRDAGDHGENIYSTKIN